MNNNLRYHNPTDKFYTDGKCFAITTLFDTDPIVIYASCEQDALDIFVDECKGAGQIKIDAVKWYEDDIHPDEVSYLGNNGTPCDLTHVRIEDMRGKDCPIDPSLPAYLKDQSKDICKDNGCTEEDHFCESYAYFNIDETGIELATICSPDYCQRQYDACLPLPFEGNEADLISSLIVD